MPLILTIFTVSIDVTRIFTKRRANRIGHAPNNIITNSNIAVFIGNISPKLFWRFWSSCTQSDYNQIGLYRTQPRPVTAGKQIKILKKKHRCIRRFYHIIFFSVTRSQAPYCSFHNKYNCSAQVIMGNGSRLKSVTI